MLKCFTGNPRTSFSPGRRSKKCIAEAEMAQSAHSLSLIDAHCQKIVAVAKDALDQAQLQEDADRHDAERFRKLCAILQGTYNDTAFESDDLTVYCSMLSGWRNERTVKAEITWRDERDADLDLASVLDKINL